MDLPVLEDISGLTIRRDAPMSEFTRFALGGPADLLVDVPDEVTFGLVWARALASGSRIQVIGAGSNLVVSDEGFRGTIIRYSGNRLVQEGSRVVAGAGAVLQDLVDFTIARGLSGMHTMTGIPGWIGGAVYGNAGAYGRSIDLSVSRVRFFDGETIQEFTNEECCFRYRESTFKDHKGWVVFSTELQLLQGNRDELRKTADEIRAIRDAKYPPEMKCAGSIFKNLIFAELPERARAAVDPRVIREGKVPSAWFLEQVGGKGIQNGDIKVADYHANLIYNNGRGTAIQVREIIDDLKFRVCARFGFSPEEEVQYVGF